MKRRMSLWLALSLVALLGLALLPACQGNVTTQDIQGFLQAVEGKEMVVTLADGSTARITIENAQAGTQAGSLVGTRVEVKVRTSGEKMELAEVRSLGEDQKLSGAITSLTKDAVVLAGKTFKIDANTRLDGGLMPGVTARVEFITKPDGTMLATEVQTDQDDDHFTGVIESLSKDMVKIGGKTFQISEVTMLDKGLAAGVQARVEFTTKPDGTMVAMEVETDRDDVHFAGAIESLGGNMAKIGGQTFVVNQATRLDNGIVTGAIARVEFIKMADGTLVAKEIQVDQQEFYVKGTLDSRSGNVIVIGGNTFKVSDTTRISDDIKPGEKVEVEFITLSDGSKVAARVHTERAGDDNGNGSGREAEARGREAEGEGARGQEAEARGREAEGEGPRGGDDSAGSSGGDDSGGSGGGSGSSGGGGADDSGGGSGSSGSGK